MRCEICNAAPLPKNIVPHVWLTLIDGVTTCSSILCITKARELAKARDLQLSRSREIVFDTTVDITQS